MENKTCKKCRQVLPVSSFHKQGKSPDGHHSWCKACRKAYEAARYASNGEAIKRYNRAWKAQNQAKIINARVRARYPFIQDEITNDQLDSLLEQHNQQCHYCGVSLSKSNRSFDHKIPLSRSGSHTIENIVPCCMDCNRRKGQRSGWSLEKWLGQQFL